MDLKINGKNVSIDGDSVTVSELLKLENVQMPDMVSVQLNGEFVDRSEFDSKTAGNGDEVDFLYFMGGGQY